MSLNECPFGWPTPEVSEHSLESKAPIPIVWQRFHSTKPGTQQRNTNVDTFSPGMWVGANPGERMRSLCESRTLFSRLQWGSD